MLFSSSKRTFFAVFILLVIVVNIILQSNVTEDANSHSSEEEKILANIRAMRKEFNQLELAEELLKKDPHNFAHPDVLNSLHITETEERENLLLGDRAVHDSSHTVTTPLERSGSDSALHPPTKTQSQPPPVSTKSSSSTATAKTPLPEATVAKVSTKPLPVSEPHTEPSGPTHDLVSSLPTSSSSSTDNILVVGGTDGSGTRRVVQLLTKLGVTVVSEDPETFDIHADLFGGWPEVVTPVLVSSGSIVAAPESYPRPLQTKITSALSRLLTKATGDAKRPQSYRLAQGGALDRPKGAHSSRVNFAFKAPVAMTLVPWWLQVADKLMFLHVMRDGRDIAFSANQGPVNKFFAPMYGKRGGQDLPTGGVPGKAIKLWADWNNGLRVWAEEKMKLLGGSDKRAKAQQFDYLPIHIEDLVDASDVVRLNAISRVAQFVGSDLDDDSLCCLAVEGSTFMGSHDRAGKIGSSGESQLKSKFGKWKAKFKADPNAEKLLMKWGKEALKDLGYLRMEDNLERIKKDFSKRMSGKYQCTLNKLQCAAKARGVEAWRKAGTKAGSSSEASLCRFRDNTDFRGGRSMDVDISSLSTSAPDECCRRCVELGECKFFTFVPQDSICYLKRKRGVEVSDEFTEGLVSGEVGR